MALNDEYEQFSQGRLYAPVSRLVPGDHAENTLVFEDHAWENGVCRCGDTTAKDELHIDG